MSLGFEILKYRAKNNLSQKEMAKRCGVTTQTIFNIEHDIQTPSKLTEMKIRMVIDEEGEVTNENNRQ